MRRSFLILLLLGLGCLATVLPPRPAQARTLCFPDRPQIPGCLEEPFESFWQRNGGLPVFGYPLGDVETDPVLAQWTERARLEFFPRNAPAYQIQLGRLGAERLARLGRNPAAEGRESGPLPGCLWFEQTGHNVCDQQRGVGFRTYWRSNGLRIVGLDSYERSLALFGLPLTAARPEINSNGDQVLTQWFERARLEWYPGNPVRFRVLQGLLGTELRTFGEPPAVSDVTRASIAGVTIAPGQIGAAAGRAAEANINWVRYGDILWSEVEPAPGVRDWSRLAGVEAQLRELSARGLTPIVVVRSAPEWAQQRPGYSCGPIKPEAYDFFASFMRDLAARYGRSPYNVRYWEIWNEPDVDPALVPGNSGIGCWGDPNDPFYGGGAYGQMIQHAYPAIKQGNPNARVLLGGLLLDCDAERPTPGKDCGPSRFLEGVLNSGAGWAFDILSYHGYAYWEPNTTVDWELNLVDWRHRGGAVLGKLNLIRTTMARYNVNKPVILTEASLLCWQSREDCANRYPDAQANYVVRVYARSLANGLIGVVWYTLDGPGWFNSGLLDGAQQPRPAYRTLEIMGRILRGASYGGRIQHPIIEGYIIRNGQTTYQINWTNSVDQQATIALPPQTRAVYNKYGERIDLSGAAVTVGFDPVIIESGP
ncbi:MAG TPA: hypothetical protein VFS21_39625 [Roseiflexaceae bacterium]|nr:hypothetical protein [Roseiflexaceae bacterium]